LRRETVDHVVRQGDSLFNIAKRYGTTTEDIQRLNNLSGTGLTVGQVLKIVPAASSAKTAAPKPSQEVYLVRPGDTLYSIAKKHNITIERLLALNQSLPAASSNPGRRFYGLDDRSLISPVETWDTSSAGGSARRSCASD
jgi:membrane-bound lytic murein transglycosylase D